MLLFRGPERARSQSSAPFGVSDNHRGTSLELDCVSDASGQEMRWRSTEEFPERAHLAKVRAGFILALEVRHFVTQDRRQLHCLEQAVSRSLVNRARRVDIDSRYSLPHIRAGPFDDLAKHAWQPTYVDDFNGHRG
jgi:hypothetical protein